MNKPFWEINKEKYYHRVSNLIYFISNVKNEGRFNELLKADPKISDFLTQYDNYYDHLQRHFSLSEINNMIQSAKCFTKVR